MYAKSWEQEGAEQGVGGEAQGAWGVKVTGREVRWGTEVHRGQTTGPGGNGDVLILIPPGGFKQGNDMFIFEFYGVFPQPGPSLISTDMLEIIITGSFMPLCIPLHA